MTIRPKREFPDEMKERPKESSLKMKVLWMWLEYIIKYLGTYLYQQTQ